MRRSLRFMKGHCCHWLVVALLCAGNCAELAAAEPPEPDDAAAALGARYFNLKEKLGHSPFLRPLTMDSKESTSSVSGEIHAVFDHPFTGLSEALRQPARWCDILILHQNTKYCRASNPSVSDVRAAPAMLNVAIGKKNEQPLADAFPVNFDYRVLASSPNFLKLTLSADHGPLSTRNYRILVEAIPLDSRRSFIHLSYSYDFGISGRLAMLAYLGTVGRSKVGFTIIGNFANGQPQYVGGMRGLVERNTIRYYLAIEAFMNAQATPAPARIEKSLRDWFIAAERYPLQLHELEQDEYLAMKRMEYRRQQADAPTVMGFVPAN
jgi:hypothetical protein